MGRILEISTGLILFSIPAIGWHANFMFFSDQNKFLQSFMGGDLLNLLGVIMTIALAVCAKLNSEINRIEAHYKRSIYKDTRKAITRSVFFLVVIFLIAFIALMFKGSYSEPRIQSIINLVLIELVLAYVWILIDFIRMSFVINVDEFLVDNND